MGRVCAGPQNDYDRLDRAAEDDFFAANELAATDKTSSNDRFRASAKARLAAAAACPERANRQIELAHLAYESIATADKTPADVAEALGLCYALIAAIQRDPGQFHEVAQASVEAARDELRRELRLHMQAVKHAGSAEALAVLDGAYRAYATALVHDPSLEVMGGAMGVGHALLVRLRSVPGAAHQPKIDAVAAEVASLRHQLFDHLKTVATSDAVAAVDIYEEVYLAYEDALPYDQSVEFLGEALCAAYALLGRLAREPGLAGRITAAEATKRRDALRDALKDRLDAARAEPDDERRRLSTAVSHAHRRVLQFDRGVTAVTDALVFASALVVWLESTDLAPSGGILVADAAALRDRSRSALRALVEATTEAQPAAALATLRTAHRTHEALLEHDKSIDAVRDALTVCYLLLARLAKRSEAERAAVAQQRGYLLYLLQEQVEADRAVLAAGPAKGKQRFGESLARTAAALEIYTKILQFGGDRFIRSEARAVCKSLQRGSTRRWVDPAVRSQLGRQCDEPPSRERALVATGATLVGVGAGSLLGMVVGLGLGARTQAALETTPDADRAPLFVRGRRENLAATVLGTAGGFLVLGALLPLGLGMKAKYQRELSLRPQFGARTVMLQLTTRF